MVNGTARFTADTNYPGYPKEEMLQSMNQYRENWEGFFCPFLTEVAPIPWTDIDTLFNLLQRNVTNEGMAALVEELNLVDVRSELANIKCQTLVIHSTNDQVIPFSQAQYPASHIKNAKLHRLENADHHINPAYNDEIVQVIAEFVSSL